MDILLIRNSCFTAAGGKVVGGTTAGCGARKTGGCGNVWCGREWKLYLGGFGARATSGGEKYVGGCCRTR